MLEILNRVGREPWLEKMGEAYKWLEETFPADYPGIYDVFKKAVKSIGGAAGLI